ncbi:nucleostemin 4 isoform X2 [Rhynchophorus ferrugineus]|uniref:nucleostemin 4 isoform X2 n=1 Tax=Rhynchophorus ferrugineus TaxID=354439 RepID=UPI003FCC7E56
MPQGRRKTPFSGKAKKEQLKTKREKHGKKVPFLQKPGGDSEDESGPSVQRINHQPGKSGRSKPNKYALQFFRETNEEIKEKKELARQSLKVIDEKELEIDGDLFFENKLDFPKRPHWNFDLSKEQLDIQENKYFTDYLKTIEAGFDTKDLSYFELNLETWRQLWRVLEMSDIVLFIVDIRFPAVMFPPSLYQYVTEELKKDFILVLNKIDLAPAPLVAAWKHYFQQKYPLLKLCMFTSLPGYNLIGQRTDKGGLQVRRRKGRIRMAAEGNQQLYEVCNSLVGDKVDLTSWHNKIKEEMEEDYQEEEKVEVGKMLHVQNNTEFFQYERFKGGVLTIGCIGQPNVGKSSLMNAIMGKKVVSVSKTPGHTKHFQTIFLTNNVRLCDCPGLVFPSKVPKPLQVLMGSFPIAQLREPYSTVKYLAERLDLVKMLRIDHPYNDEVWSAMDICDGWAKKRGYITAKAARLDSYRGANSVLRMALDGKICFCLRPPHYARRKDFWQTHQDLEMVRWIQALTVEEEGDDHLNRSVGDGNSDMSSDNDDHNRHATDDEDTSGSSSSAPEVAGALSSNKYATLELDD